ncbi:type I-F CRISPR-associated endoribonuclease Cas6/Csy4 [Acinetobacter ursingii]|uniref:CRISPR-associated protein cas6/csy4, subtype I-f/ypest n=2 Tax=Acinetobacter TaxID=469 RepID=N9DGT4_9GAMM|nr:MULTISPECIES: type I-F CRISPR-associated endoribonuclease Cas6/Csy4 [Acinetobacter]ENV79713.1 CRISPR-associated protein cas6/csy4, subtype I-f/ypest [Acinetobacter ursingii ANC 3649]MDG9949176.1 type I-F CRISPR-associated endoribonuclease Cas6/Csy4 [Acinetobacter ursingii]MEC6126733.1 type I-F CRISPR-associated endoribonuclease Cas6/Csy4 [Acinetobacter ursingii]PZT87813.1 MAG: type I-F CRISPR-associated endoribonuclease Cas6/Csy4 [Acinetobacter sp.]QXZ23187.1 type I-F CRISPR-associated endo
MLYYLEITLLEQEEIPLHLIWSKVYTQLHIAFVEQADEEGKISYGVSFPKYRLIQQKKLGYLGDKIRIFADSVEALEQLNLTHWFARLQDYVHVLSARKVPEDKINGYAAYFKVNPKLTVEQRVVHQAERRGISIEEAQEHFKALDLTETFEPYINMKSQTNDMSFRLIIGKRRVDEANIGKFGSYGLSRTSTVPEF